MVIECKNEIGKNRNLQEKEGEKEMSENKKEEIQIEVVYDLLKLVAIEKVFGKMPHPLRFFKFQRWVHDSEAFLKGVEFCKNFMQKVEKEKITKERKEK